MANKIQPRIVIVGGGFGGLEAAFYLRMRLADQAHITLISDQDYFLFKPNTIYIPFGLDPEKLKIKLAGPTRNKHIRFIQSRVREIDPVTRMLHTETDHIPYDYLVVATGAGMRPNEVTGLQAYAKTIWTPQDMLQLRAAYHSLLSSSQRQQVVFLVPPNNKCSGPLYEMVMMLDTWLRRKGARKQIDITWATYEQGYIQAFGPRLDTTVSEEFARRNITGYKGYVVDRVEQSSVWSKTGQQLRYDLLIAFPPYVASTPFPSLPLDERGFVATEMPSRQVLGLDTVYAVGDAGDFPVKQAFLAFLQADAAAEHISAQVLGTKPRVTFEPVSMCVMEEFDTATFAQVPLRLTGDPVRPIEVQPGAESMYKVGTSPLWRLGKQLLGVYLPWRFRAGNAFHAGIPWRGMEAGLKVMSSVLAK